MALQRDGRWNVSMTFQDNNDKTATMSFYVSDVLVYPVGIENFLNAVREQVVLLTDSALIGATVSRNYTEDAPLDPIPATSEVERKLRFPFTTAIRGHGTLVEIPSPAFVTEQDGTDVPLLSNPAIAAFIDIFVNGGLGFENGGVTNANVQITGADTPFVLHRNRRKRA